MLIGLEKRFVFVANTKTASTSIESVLAPHAEIHHAGTPERKHIPLAKALPLYPEHFGPAGDRAGDYFKFGVMRDPIDWIGSWFRYRKGNKVAAPLPSDMDFAAFWAAGDWNIRRGDGTPYLQRRLFCDAQGGLLADMIIPYDRLGPLFGEICDALGVEATLPRENASRLRDFELPADLEDAVRAHYAPDYALWETLDAVNTRGLEKLRALAG